MRKPSSGAGGRGMGGGMGGGGMPAFDLRPTRVVTRLMVAMVGIHLVAAGLVNLAGISWAADLFHDHLALTPASAVLELELWQVVTYAWLHDLQSPGHLIFNMLGLFFLGPSLEKRWGSRPFFWFWFNSCLIAGIVTVVAGLVMPSLFGGAVVGASGGVMALLAAYSLVMPDAVILLAFVLPIRARYIIWIAVGIDTVMFVSGGSRVAWQTHMGGVLGAWLLITGNWRPRLAWDRARLWALNLGKRRQQRRLRVIKGGRDGKGPRYLN